MRGFRAPIASFLSSAVLAGCTQILGVEEGRFEGTGGTGGSTSSSTTAVTTGAPPCEPVDCDDDNACTSDTCAAGTCQHANLPSGTPCGNGLTCDAAGACDVCTSAPQCGTDTACATYSCVAMKCEVVFQPMGASAGNSVEGDCLTDVCTGSSPAPMAVPADDPPNDEEPACVTLGCTDTAQVFPFPKPAAVGDGCTDEQGNGQCGRDGECNSCLTSFDCPTSEFGSACSVITQRCGCDSNADCASPSARGPMCSQSQCRCTSDAECAANLRGSQCVNSWCGCNDESDCASVPGKPVCGPTQICIPVQL
ncbi:MAG: hypothetical protein JNL21_08355 [Myxococcales bacterium]|nr:hypothetical protein [Myxococcales bacterium]